MTRWVVVLVITVVLARWVVYRCLYRKHRVTLTTRRNQSAAAWDDTTL